MSRISKPHMKALLTTNEVCEIFQVHRTTIYRWYREGLFSCIKVGRKNLFDPDEIQRVINKKKFSL